MQVRGAKPLQRAVTAEMLPKRCTPGRQGAAYLARRRRQALLQELHRHLVSHFIQWHVVHHSLHLGHSLQKVEVDWDELPIPAAVEAWGVTRPHGGSLLHAG